MTATYQTTENPYALKQVYGKDVCELMRRINALEARTVPMDQASADSLFSSWYSSFMIAVTPSGSVVYVIGWRIHEDSTDRYARYRVRIWTANPPAGSTGSWTVVDHGELSNGETFFPLKWPMVPEWCGCDNDGRLYLKIRWAYDTIIGGTPASTFIRTNGGSGFSYTRLTHSVPSGMINFADTPYKILGEYRDNNPLGGVKFNKCWVRGLSDGIEVHGFCGSSDSYTSPGPQTFYNIETYNSNMVMTGIRIFYVGAERSYFPFVLSPAGANVAGASEDYGAGCLNLKAMVELDPTEAWVYPDWPEPAEHWEDVFAVGTPAAGGGGIPIVWGGTGFSQTASTRIILCPANVAGFPGTNPMCASVQLTSTKNPTTGRWTHSLGEKQLRLGRLGPVDYAQYQHVRVALSDVAPNVPGKVFCITTGGDPPSFGLLRWRVLEHRATQTEWFGYLPNGTKQSLGTPDNGETVPTNNALVAVGASTCAEHIMDMRAALKKLMDDNWACVFYSSTYEPWVSGARGWRLAAWDFWGKYAGVVGSIGIVASPIEGEFRCKPALYMALAQANHVATSPKQQYGLEVERYSVSGPKIPTGKYWEFRKADAAAMDNTPMHDIDIGEIRALVEMMEASYNTVTYPVQDEDDWIPDIDWR